MWCLPGWTAWLPVRPTKQTVHNCQHLRHFPTTPKYCNLHSSTPADTLHIHYKAKLASLHSTCMAMLTFNGWILHLIFTPLLFGAFVVSGTMSSFNPLSFTLAYHTLHTLAFLLQSKFALLLSTHHLKVCASIGSPVTHSYHLHPILCTSDAVATCTSVMPPFLSTWGAVMLTKIQRYNKKQFLGYRLSAVCVQLWLACIQRLFCWQQNRSNYFHLPFITPQVGEKIVEWMNEWIKSHKSACACPMF